MNNIQDDYKFARSSKEAFGSNFYTEEKPVRLSFVVTGIIILILLGVGLL